MSSCMVDLNAEKWTGPAKDYQVDLCPEPAAYRAWIADCFMCWLSDCPECAGHPVCIKHGAELRAESEALKDKGKPAVLVRISSLAAAEGAA